MHSYGIRWQNGAENGELFLRVPSSILMSVTFDHEEGGGINSDEGCTCMYSQDIIELYQNGVQIVMDLRRPSVQHNMCT